MSDAMLGISWDILTHPERLETRVERIKRLQVDMDIGSSLPRDDAYIHYPLLSCGVQMVCRKEHPRIKAVMSMEQYLQEKTVGIIPVHEQLGSELLGSSYIEDYLLFRHFRCTVGITVLLLAAQYDIITFVPSSLTKWICARFNLKVIESDFPVSGVFEIYAHIHRLRKNDLILKRLIELFARLKN